MKHTPHCIANGGNVLQSHGTVPCSDASPTEECAFYDVAHKELAAAPLRFTCDDHAKPADCHNCRRTEAYFRAGRNEGAAQAIAIWRAALEWALGQESDPVNHTPGFYASLVREIREIGNQPRAAAERASIVKFLQRLDAPGWDLRRVAGRIERGEHVRNSEGEGKDGQ